MRNEMISFVSDMGFDFGRQLWVRNTCMLFSSHSPTRQKVGTYWSTRRGQMECKIVAIGERLENRSLVDLELGLVQEVTAEVEFTRP